MKKGKKWMMGLLSTLLIAQSLPVYAAENPKISLVGTVDDKDDRHVEVDCRIDGAKGITNGKLRIYYDEDKAELVSQKTGEVLEGGLCEVNDCLTGNKPEGELVAAFASSQDIKEKGTILEMQFQLKDGVEKNEEIDFQVKTEKLSGDRGDVSVEVETLTFVAGKKGEQTSAGENKDNQQEKDDGKNGDKQKGETSSSGSSKKGGKVKTGDEAETVKYLVMGGGTLLVILSCAAASRKRRSS